MKQLAKAIIEVMKAVKGIEKKSIVGKGTRSEYSGVSDKDVKEVYNKAMSDNGLCILCTDVQDEIEVNRWTDQYGKNKQSVFCSVKTKYLLLHVSGESKEIAGYGHGVDAQDKAAGKATTYAMKYALLYTFMTPTGKIDDSDKTHSEEHEVPPKAKQLTPPERKSIQNNNELEKVYNWIDEKHPSLEIVKKYYKLTAKQEEAITAKIVANG